METTNTKATEFMQNKTAAIDNCDIDSLEGDDEQKELRHHNCNRTNDCEKIITNLNFRTEEELVRMLGEADVLSQSTSSLSDNAVISPSVSIQALDGDTKDITNDKGKTSKKVVNGESKEKPKPSTVKNNPNVTFTRRHTTDATPYKPKRASSARDLSKKGLDSKLKFTKKKSPSETLKLCEKKSPNEALRLCEKRSPLDECHGFRDTVTSRMRYEKGHNSHELNECEGDDYLTPTQRKEVELKQIRKEVKNLRKDLADKTEEIEMLKKNIDKEAAAIIADKDLKISAIRDEMKTLQDELEDLRMSYEESVKNVSALEITIVNLKETMAIREKKNADIYLEMYRKGQESAKFERNDELERMAVRCDGSSSATIKELLEKLMSTEMELAKWQALRRQESYDAAEKPDTEAAATIRFLRDSFFHYLIDPKESENHLRAMIRIFNFTDPQKNKIANALADKKSRRPSMAK